MNKILLLGLLLPALLLSGCVAAERGSNKETIVVRTEEGGFNPVKIYQEDSPAVVTVLALGAGASGQGSGFLVSRDGKIVTNAHVLTGLDGRRVASKIYIEYKSKARKSARVLLVDRNSDLALLKAEVPGGVDPLQLSERRRFLPGEPVAAIGSPFGQSQSLSTGIISAVGRSVQSLTNFTIDNALQTDASINPGNSGGPLLDSAGEVIGINQQIQTQSGGNDGVGYAIPVSALQRLLRAAEQGEEVEYAYLGVASQDVWADLAKKLQVPFPSALIAEVVDGGPAQEAGLRGGERRIMFQGGQVAIGGDVLLSIDGQRVGGASDVAEAITSRSPGDEVEIVYYRDGKKRSTVVTLGRRP